MNRFGRIAIAMLVAAGCAGGETTPAVRCDLACARDDNCNMGSSSPFCAADCPDRLLALLPEFREPFLDCYADNTCNDEEVDCEVEASSELAQRPIDDNFIDQCQPVQGDCEGSFDSAFCFLTRYYEEAAVEAAMACLAMPCTAVEACLRLELPLAPFD